MRFFVGGILAFLFVCAVIDAYLGSVYDLEPEPVTAAYLGKVETAEMLHDIAMPVGDWLYEVHKTKDNKEYVFISKIKIIDSGEFSIQYELKSQDEDSAKGTLSGVFRVSGSSLHASNLVGASVFIAANKKVVISEVGSDFMSIVDYEHPENSFKYIKLHTE